jgi:hypothetical protein
VPKDHLGALPMLVKTLWRSGKLAKVASRHPRPARRAGVLKDEVTTVQNRGAKERHCYEATRPGRESNSSSLHFIQIVHPEAY